MIKPIKATPLQDYVLDIEFNTGEKRKLDMKPFFELPYYTSLRDVRIFRSVTVGEYTLEWANGRDISPHELYDYSVPYAE